MVLQGHCSGQPLVVVLLDGHGAFARSFEPVVVGTNGESDFGVARAIELQSVAPLPCRVTELHRQRLRTSGCGPLENDRPSVRYHSTHGPGLGPGRIRRTEKPTHRRRNERTVALLARSAPEGPAPEPVSCSQHAPG